ncbi:MAG: efflux transporter outer membrane subunit [Mariprofundus sp.]|nr:efflux transporter outer membrane subunit [Mariprofundus sp.]
MRVLYPNMNALLVSLLALVLTACVVGPDFQRPASPKVDHYYNKGSDVTSSDAEQNKLVTRENIPAQWWQLFESPALQQLVELGLKDSPTLIAAKAKLKATQETYSAQSGSILLPSVDASVNSSRKKISGAAFGSTAFGSLYTVHAASVDVSYSLDLFGGERRTLEYSQAQVDYDAFQLHAAQITLVSNIVTAAINEASLREQVEALKEIIASETEQLNVTEKQYEIGVVAKVELLSQRVTLAQTRTQLPLLQKQQAQAKHQLSMLIGRTPGGEALPAFNLSELVMPREIPLTLPSTLTRQRPDVRASEALLHQASAQIGVATANLYPNLTLTGSYGTEAAKISDLFNAGTAVWGLGAGLLQPLFRGGALRAKKRAAIALYEQAAAQYRQSVLTAFQNVADALLALDMDGQGLVLEKRAEGLASERLELVLLQHQHGAVSYLDLLNAQKQYQQARINLIQSRAVLYSDTAALMYALGGGWWNGDVAADQNMIDQTNLERTDLKQTGLDQVVIDQNVNVEKQQ